MHCSQGLEGRHENNQGVVVLGALEIIRAAGGRKIDDRGHCTNLEHALLDRGHRDHCLVGVCLAEHGRMTSSS